jgi:DNA repair exonuclease SbcCD ATPase subunit
MPSYDLNSETQTVTQPDPGVSENHKRKVDEKAKTERRKREMQRRQREELLDKVGADMPDLPTPETDDRVKQLHRKAEALRDELNGFLDEAQARVQQAKTAVDEAEDHLVEVEADHELGDATEEEVEAAKEDLADAEEELGAAQESLQARKDRKIRKKRTLQIVEDKMKERKQKVLMKRDKAVEGALRKQARAVVSALEEARQEVEELYVLVERLPTENLELRRPDWTNLPIQPTLRGQGQTRYRQALGSLEVLGVEVPDFEAAGGEYVEPQT